MLLRKIRNCQCDLCIRAMKTQTTFLIQKQLTYRFIIRSVKLFLCECNMLSFCIAGRFS